MLGFELTIRDYLTFARAAVAGIAVIVILLWIAGLPGQIANRIQPHLALGGSFDAAPSVAELAGVK